jgi:cyclophilin family peptidyl-prolyl cis-trans isomerase
MSHRFSLSFAGTLALSVLSAGAAAPTFPAHPNETDVPPNLPIGKTLIIPLAVDDTDGDPVSLTVTSSNPKINARVRTGNFHYKFKALTTDDGSVPGTPTSFQGDMEFELYRAATPETAAFIAGFAQGAYYDNVQIHRVSPGFVIQGGDPTGTGRGTSPYNLRHEFVKELIYSGRGQIAMANSQGGYEQSFPSANFLYRTGSFKPTNGSQFFVTLGQPRVLDFRHTNFGQLVRGFDTLDKLGSVAVNADGIAGTDDDETPKTIITMKEHVVSSSLTDGVLLLSATDSASANIKITAKDPSGATATRTIVVNSFVDTTNDPPILQPFSPVVMPIGSFPSFSIRSVDLENDAISTRMPVQNLLAGGVIYYGVNANNLAAVAPSDVGAWDVAIGVSGINDPLLDIDPFSASRFQTLEVGVGDMAIVATPEHIEGDENVSTFNLLLATFRHGAAGASPDDFVATVNWGDGTELRTSGAVGSPITIVRSPSQAGAFEVRGGHLFSKAGFYPLHVTIDNVNGATATAKGTSTIYPAGTTLRATGEDLVFQGANFTGRPVAYFTDSQAGAAVGSYSVIIDWGDGQRTPGTVRQVATNRFAVMGTHRYVDAETFSLAVHIQRPGMPATPATPVAKAVAWGTVSLTGFAGPHYLPPYSNSNISTVWSEDPSKTYRTPISTDLSATLFLINGGNKPTGKWKLRFWLSNDATLNKVPDAALQQPADIPLKFGPLNKQIKELALNSLVPGAGGNLTLNKFKGGDFTIRLPDRETASGKYLLAEVDYHDPLTDKLPISKVLPYGPFLGIIVNKASLTVGEELAPRTDKFKVRLDTLPDAPVTIPLDITLGGVVDTTHAMLSKSSLTFSPLDGTTEQEVTVTAIDDGLQNSATGFVVRLKPATSADQRFTGMNGGDISLKIVDSTKNIIVSRTSATIRESVLGTVTTSTTFTVKLQSLPAQDVTVPFQIENSTGTVDNSRATLSVGQLVFTPINGTTTQTVTVTAVNDTDDNGNVTFNIRFLPATGADATFAGRTAPKIAVTVQDDDEPPATP